MYLPIFRIKMLGTCRKTFPKRESKELPPVLALLSVSLAETQTLK